MVYSYKCSDCAMVSEVWGVRMDDRDTPQKCEACGGVAHYDFGATVQTSRVTTQQDLVSYMENRFGKSPTWMGATSNHEPPLKYGTKKAGARRSFAGDPGPGRETPRSWV